MSNEYTTLRRLLTAEQRRRAAYYKYRPTERAGAMAEIADALAALERLRVASDWGKVGKFWTDKFD